MKTKIVLVGAALALSAFAGEKLKNPAKAELWNGSVTRNAGPVGEVPECANGCQRVDLDIDLPGGVWNNKPGGVQVAIRWAGGTFGDNLRLYVYRGSSLIAKSDGIIAIAQSVLIPQPANGPVKIYIAYDPDSTTNPIAYEGLAEVEYTPNVQPLRRLMPDLEARPQRNLTFNPGGIFFDTISDLYPSCYVSEVQEENARLCLRFDQIFANTGQGPMELRFSVPAGTTPALTSVFQRIYWSDGASHFEDRPAGQVVWHDAHQHYHFASFGISRLWAIDTATGKQKGNSPVRERKLKRMPKQNQVSAGRKVSFCLADTEIDAWAKKGDGARTYIAPDCLFPAFAAGGLDHYVQGITPGWGDIYDYYLPDQYIDVFNVPNGDYILENVGDPDGKLAEVSETNNCSSIRIRLQNLSTANPSVQILGPGPACR